MNSIKRFGILRSACVFTLAGIMAIGSVLSASADANDGKITAEQIMQENKTFDFLSTTDTFHVLTAYEVTVDNCGTFQKLYPTAVQSVNYWTGQGFQLTKIKLLFRA